MACALIYKPKYTFTENVLSMEINSCGTRLAAITEGGFINVWNISTGERYYPILGPEMGLSPCILWMDDSAFLCGIQNGYTMACYLIDNGDEEGGVSLTVTKRKMVDTLTDNAHKPCNHALSYEISHQCLAITTHDSIQLWMRDRKEWKFRRSLTYSYIPRHPEQVVCITSVAWVPNEGRILATYMNHDTVVWDIALPSVGRTIKSWGNSIQKSEILMNSGGTRLATVDSRNLFDVYDLSSGAVWSPSLAMRVFALKSIHRGTTCVLGSNGKSELLDIESGLITQVLEQSDGAAQVRAIAGYQDESETEFIIVTASAGQCIIWKAEDCL